MSLEQDARAGDTVATHTHTHFPGFEVLSVTMWVGVTQ